MEEVVTWRICMSFRFWSTLIDDHVTRIPTVKLKIPGKAFLKSELLFPEFSISPPGSYTWPNLFEISLLIRLEQLKVDQKRNFEQVESRYHQFGWIKSETACICFTWLRDQRTIRRCAVLLGPSSVHSKRTLLWNWNDFEETHDTNNWNFINE